MSFKIQTLFIPLSIHFFLITQGLNADSLGKNDRYLLQFLLKQSGYDVGVVDGKIGPRTRSKLAEISNSSPLLTLKSLMKDYEKKNGVNPDRVVSNIKSSTELQQKYVYGGDSGKGRWKDKRFRLLPPMSRLNLWKPQNENAKRPDYQGFWGLHSGPVDINNDGYDDWVITTNPIIHAAFTGSKCDPIRSCDYGGVPVVYLNNGKGAWEVQDDWFKDYRKFPGSVMEMPPIYADFNGDEIVDLFSAGTRQDKPFRDSYYLSSRQGGKHIESSMTHMSNITSDFSHGYAVGDIDGNGWVDIVTTSSWVSYKNPTNIHCYFNVGYGFLRSDKECGKNILGEKFVSSSITLADVNGDSYLDLVFTGSEYFNGGVGIALNNGSGIFGKGSDIIKRKMVYFEVMPNIFSFDLDGDKDLDLIGWVHRSFYNGAGVVIIENIDQGKKWKQTIYPLVTPDETDPKFHKTMEEENGPWNLWMHSLFFEDVNNDKKIDIVLDGSVQQDVPLPVTEDRSNLPISEMIIVNGSKYNLDKTIALDQIRGAALLQLDRMQFEHQKNIWRELSDRKFN